MLGPESSFEIIGGNDAERIETRETTRESRRGHESELKQFEIIETEKDREIIEQVEDAVDAEIRHHGGNPSQFPRDRIHVVRPGAVESLGGGRFKGAFVTHLEEYVVVERNPSDTEFATLLAHELFHLKSPKSATLSDGDGKLRLYRSGITMIDRKHPDVGRGYEKQYFGALEEALVAEATDRVFRELAQSNEFVKTEVALFERTKPWLRKLLAKAKQLPANTETVLQAFRAIPTQDSKDLLDVLEGSDQTESQKVAFLYGTLLRLFEQGAIANAERTEERAKLDRFVDDLVARYDGRMTREQIMEEFFEANFTGRYLGVARMIEGVMGKGAFRRVAEEFSEPAQAA